MKPENWDDLTEEEAREAAEDLLRSSRGQFLIGQAIAIAATVLDTRGDESNAEELEKIGETLFEEGFRIERSRLADDLY